MDEARFVNPASCAGGTPACGAGGHPAPAPAVMAFPALGSEVTVAVRAAGAARADELVRRGRELVDAYERRWSRFVEGSVGAQLRPGPARVVVLDDESASLVALALDAREVTGGRFDPTVLAAVLAVGYDRTHAELEGRDLPAVPAPPAVDRWPVLDRARGTLLLPEGVGIDLGGLGKGHIADLVATALVESGAAGAVVDAGGDVRCAGAGPWRVAVEAWPGAPRTVVELRCGAVCTSVVRSAWTQGGRPVHDLIDPATGRPATSDLAAATVVAGTAAWAEVFATAVLVAGERDGVALVGDHGLAALLVRADGTPVQVGLERYGLERSGITVGGRAA